MMVICATCHVLLYRTKSTNGDADHPSHGTCRRHELETYEEASLLRPWERWELAVRRCIDRLTVALP